MIRFLFKGLLRDPHRSRFPIIIVTIGVTLTVVAHCWITGVFGDIINYNARFLTGHVKIMSQAYSKNMDQMPNDLALLNANKLMQNLRTNYPKMTWVNRIRFGALLDVPDENGETREQGTVFGMGIDLLSKGTTEIRRLGITDAIVRGHMPGKPGEILLSEDFTENLDLNPDDTITLITSTMYGDMSLENYKIAGTLRFGVKAMDRGALIMDIEDARYLLDMEDAASEILGYFDTSIYPRQKAVDLANAFNHQYIKQDDEFSPIMLPLTKQNDLDSIIDFTDHVAGIVITTFIAVMSIVLWNSGLIGGLRRYGEVGLRLAIGEYKGHVYRSMIAESIMIGVIGTLIGSLIGLGLAYLLQTIGIDIGSMMENVTMMMPTVFRARITPPAFYIGFFPGLFSTVLGTALAGVGIYRRKTAQLFKELEV